MIPIGKDMAASDFCVRPQIDYAAMDAAEAARKATPPFWYVEKQERCRMDSTKLEIMAERKAPAFTERIYFSVPWADSPAYAVGTQLNLSISPCPKPNPPPS